MSRPLTERFAALVDRHGPMVLGVCRALIRDVHAADDAFQATFLVLARRAASIRDPGLLANWLYGVAHRTARNVRPQALGRRTRQAEEVEVSALEVVDKNGGQEMSLIQEEPVSLIHRELDRLSSPQRAVVVLCWLEGLTVS